MTNKVKEKRLAGSKKPLNSKYQIHSKEIARRFLNGDFGLLSETDSKFARKMAETTTTQKTLYWLNVMGERAFPKEFKHVATANDYKFVDANQSYVQNRTVKDRRYARRVLEKGHM
jgi:hypothetical protein